MIKILLCIIMGKMEHKEKSHWRKIRRIVNKILRKILKNNKITKNNNYIKI